MGTGETTAALEARVRPSESSGRKGRRGGGGGGAGREQQHQQVFILLHAAVEEDEGEAKVLGSDERGGVEFQREPSDSSPDQPS